MTDDQAAEPQSPPGLERDALTVARGLGIAAAGLAVPALLVSVGALFGLAAVAGVASTALSGDRSVVAWVLLAAGLVGIAAVLVLLLRVRNTRRAARDRAALAADLVGLVDLSEITTAFLADLAALTSREGGLRAVSRGRALWRILRRLDIGEHVTSFERVKWFLPPEVSTTWLFAQVVTWGGLGAWVLLPVLIALRASGWW